MLGNPINRLESIAKRVPSFSTPDGQPSGDYWALFETVQAFLLATGGDDLARELERAVDSPTPPSMGAIFQAIRDAGIGDTPFDGLIPWFYREIRRSGDENVIAELKRLGAAITQWQRKTRTDLGKLRAGEVINAVNEWIAESALATPAKYRGKIVYAFPDGWTVQELRDDEALEEEGDDQHMNHCVGTFCEKVAQGTSVIYSLRDRRNVPHVTMEWQPSDSRYGGRFAQIYGPGNAEPDPALRPYLVEFIQRVRREEPVGLLLTGVAASDLDLRGADLEGARLIDANLDHANLDSTNLNRARLNHANLISAYLRGASLNGASLYRANLNIARLDSASLNGADLRGAILDRAILKSASLINAILDGAILDGANFDGANLDDATLDRASLNDATLDRANLNNANLYRASLEGASLIGAKLTNAYIYRARLNAANLEGANLDSARLYGAHLYATDLRGAILIDANLDSANLNGANLNNANLNNANLANAILVGANLNGASLKGATIDEDTDFTDAIFKDTTMPDGSVYTGIGWSVR